VRPETIKLLKENIGSNLLNISLSSVFVDRSPQERETKAKIRYCDNTKIISLCRVKEIINKTKRQPTE